MSTQPLVQWRCCYCGVLLTSANGTGPRGGECPGCRTVQTPENARPA